jgi:molybdopterin-synthase adenylyltransferase
MDDHQLLKYARHILLPQIDVAGQARIGAASVLVVGLGGLGCPAAMYLATAGVGRLVLADGDVVEITNLQRQVAHTASRIGQPKVESAREALLALNPDLQIECIARRLEGDDLLAQIARADIVLDCSDNFATRHTINRGCVVHRKPLVSGAAIRFDGQVTVFDLRSDAHACYHCLFPEGEDLEELRCAVTGVFAPLVGIVGAMQAAEALKLIVGCGEALAGRLLLLNALSMDIRTVRFEKDPGCSVCRGR